MRLFVQKLNTIELAKALLAENTCDKCAKCIINESTGHSFCIDRPFVFGKGSLPKQGTCYKWKSTK